MNFRISRARFLLISAAALVLAACGGGGDYGKSLASQCDALDQEKMKSQIIDHLRKKYPNQELTVKPLNYVGATKLPFWHAHVESTNQPANQRIFGMYYCDGSMEFSAPVPL
jgi:ABC-type glycerol-3-phosphate transport system substrate-binding protein